MVLPPMRESLRRSLSEATPVMSEASTSGTAMSLRPLRKTVPKGETQSAVNSPHPCDAASTPKRRPVTRPRMIRQCSLRCQGWSALSNELPRLGLDPRQELLVRRVELLHPLHLQLVRHLREVDP